MNSSSDLKRPYCSRPVTKTKDRNCNRQIKLTGKVPSKLITITSMVLKMGAWSGVAGEDINSKLYQRLFYDDHIYKCFFYLEATIFMTRNKN